MEKEKEKEKKKEKKKITGNTVSLTIFVSIITMIMLFCLSCSQKMMAPPAASANSSGMRSMTAAKALGPYETPVTAENLNRNRMISYTVSLGLAVKDTEEAQKAILDHVKNSRGFIVEETVRETGYSITARIPSNNLDRFINNLAMLGKVVNKNKIGEDITDQYRDNVLMLESLKKIRERYLALLEEADSVNQMLVIEKELERMNREIDILTGRIKHAEAKATYSSVTIRLEKEWYAEKKTTPGPIGWVFVGLYHGIKWLFVWD